MKSRLVLGVLVFASACAQAKSEQMEYNASVITEQEIVASGAQTAYDAIKKLRGNFLATRGRTSLVEAPPEPNVYVDENFFGPVASLKSIPAQQIGSIRMYRPWEVQTKYGTNNLGGVISIYTKQ